MVGTKVLDSNVLNYSFWETWPKKFYNVRAYDNSKAIQSGLSYEEDHPLDQGHDCYEGDQAPAPDQDQNRETAQLHVQGNDEELDSPDEIPGTQQPSSNFKSRVCVTKKKNLAIY